MFLVIWMKVFNVQLDNIKRLLETNQDKEIINKKELSATLHALENDNLTFSNEMALMRIYHKGKGVA